MLIKFRLIVLLNAALPRESCWIFQRHVIRLGCWIIYRALCGSVRVSPAGAYCLVLYRHAVTCRYKTCRYMTCSGYHVRLNHKRVIRLAARSEILNICFKRRRELFNIGPFLSGVFFEFWIYDASTSCMMSHIFHETMSSLQISGQNCSIMQCDPKVLKPGVNNGDLLQYGNWIQYFSGTFNHPLHPTLKGWEP